MAKKPAPRETGKPDIEIGKKVRALRDAQNMSQASLGDHLGVSFQQIQKYEKGMNRVTAARLQKIAAIFNVPLDHFYKPNGHGDDVESLLINTGPEAIRLLRAYSRISNIETQRRMVTLMESIADGA